MTEHAALFSPGLANLRIVLYLSKVLAYASETYDIAQASHMERKKIELGRSRFLRSMRTRRILEIQFVELFCKQVLPQ
jgi:hypothetical protein